MEGKKSRTSYVLSCMQKKHLPGGKEPVEEGKRARGGLWGKWYMCMKML